MHDIFKYIAIAAITIINAIISFIALILFSAVGLIGALVLIIIAALILIAEWANDNPKEVKICLGIAAAIALFFVLLKHI